MASSKAITVALTFLALAVFSLPATFGSPAARYQPYPPQMPPQRAPIPYNLHTAFRPEDINQLSSRSRHNIARTIAEVEKVLASDPKLPRLTRGEIAELFEQVAREELQKSMMVGDYTRAKEMRALMVVLPYSASISKEMSSGNSIQELYTKPPVTKVLESDVKLLPPVTQKPSTTLAFTTTTRRSTTQQYPIPDDFMKTTSFKPLPSYDKMFPTTTERQQTSSTPASSSSASPASSTPRSDPPQVAPDVKDVLESLGLWQEDEAPMIFSKQTISQNFAPVELDFKTGTEKAAEESLESVVSKVPTPEVSPTDFVAFKPIPKLDKAEIPLENYEYFKSLGLLEPAKGSRAIASPPAKDNTPPVISKKAQGFTRRKSDVSYETEVLQKISKQEREQLLDVLKKLESQVVAGKLSLNPVDNPDNNLTKKDFKRQEATTEAVHIVEPVKFSFNLNTDDTKEETTPDLLSDDLPSSESDTQGRIVNKGSSSSAEDSSDSTTTTESSSSSSSSTTESSSSLDAETFSLPPLNPVDDDFKLDNLDDAGGLDPVADAMPPPERKNGFYFLADWNSFLEVGEGKDRVEVQFKPRVGDPRLFIPVTVP